MESLLTARSTRRTAVVEDELRPSNSALQAPDNDSIKLQIWSDALRLLQSKPSSEDLLRALQWLLPTGSLEMSVNIKIPGPQTTQLVNAIVNNVVPDYWPLLQQLDSAIMKRVRKLLLRCLTSLAGIGALLARLRALGSQELKVSTNPQPLAETFDLLENILRKDGTVSQLWTELREAAVKAAQHSLLWKELVSMLGGGRILSVAAEAGSTLNRLNPDIYEGNWVADGKLYSDWLGRNIRHFLFAKIESQDEKMKATAVLLSKAFSLGYTGRIIDVVFLQPTLGDVQNLGICRSLFRNLAKHEQKSVVLNILRIISGVYIPRQKLRDDPKVRGKVVGGIAALIREYAEDELYLQDVLVEWLTSISGGNLSSDELTRRAVIAVIASKLDALEAVLHGLLQVFGDKLYIKNTPILHQEVNARSLLMVAGYVNRVKPSSLTAVARSSMYINAISNRIAASSQRSRFLGMIVGTAISELVDPKDKRMKFSVEEIDSPDGKAFLALVQTSDSIGSIKDLLSTSAIPEKPRMSSINEVPQVRKRAKAKATTTSKIMSTEEADSSSGDDDLPTYGKPDSDPEDEEEDATLVERNKPSAPVYIRDLIAGLSDVENYNRHKLALTTAASLIRQKANFGTEVSDHCEELASRLTGLNDKYNLENFQQMRLQTMIAILVARPLQMGQWFSNTYFNGDYSMSQRAAILTTLSIGARELAGFKKEDSALTGANLVSDTPFPSKQLPDKLHKIYAAEAAPVNALTQSMERVMIQPMAMEAAEKFTGPKALKVRTFSSRMEVEKRRKKAIPNELAKIVAEGFFFPLTGGWKSHFRTFGDRSAHTSPFLLSHFLKTLALLLHASGPSTLSLPQMTSEYWSLILSIRTTATGDVMILEALLFAILTLLDVNEDKRVIAQSHARELLETQAWVEAVFEKIGGGSEEGERIRTLAAGVLVGTREVVEKHQRILLGDMADFM